MRLKKGFTLAEILIVLMVIGVIATMTIPSMMRGVTESQYKAGFKKAYNTIANFAAMEKVAGNWPGKGNDNNLAALYQGLNNALSVKTFAVQTVNDGNMLASSAENFKTCVNATIGESTIKIGEGDDCLTLHSLGEAATGTASGAEDAIWIITEDNIAYTVVAGGAGDAKCATKQTIAAQADDAGAVSKSCYVLVTDVNGLSTGPNLYETQGLGGESEDESAAENSTLEPGNALATLTGDQYKIYLGSDGATSGPRMTTVSGRIAADLK